MRTISIIRRGIAFLLMLVSFQQIGAGLFIHNLFHDKALANHTPVKQNETTKEINFACSCVDNFLMPFVSADDQLSLHKNIDHTKPVDSYTEQRYFTSLIYTTLRGPPVFIG